MKRSKSNIKVLRRAKEYSICRVKVPVVSWYICLPDGRFSRLIPYYSYHDLYRALRFPALTSGENFAKLCELVVESQIYDLNKLLEYGKNKGVEVTIRKSEYVEVSKRQFKWVYHS